MFIFDRFIFNGFWSGRLACLLLLGFSFATFAQDREGISDAEIAKLANHVMQEFQVPGMAIGIVRGNETVYAKGFGIREVGLPGQVDRDTMFKIASNSKAFTTAALAMLVDEGKIAWDGRVESYIPEFKMYDPWVSAQFTVTDLLTHRSGLSKGSGDLMLWPEPNDYTAADIIHALRYFEPSSDFRTEYAYDNSLYIVAGEIIPHVTGQSWGSFVQSRIMQPLGMERCFAAEIPISEMNNLAVPHGVVDGKMNVIERGRIPAKPPVSAAAGGIICSLNGMLPWVKTQLNRGTSPDGLQLFSLAQNKAMWRSETIRSVSERDYKLNKTHFKAYALGWRVADVHGFKEVSHTGSLAGMRSYVVLIPELELGVVVMMHGSSSTARMAVMSTIVRSFMPVEQIDWVQILVDEITTWKQEQKLKAAMAESESSIGEATTFELARISDYTGIYRDPWFGDVSLNVNDGVLTYTADKSPKLTGPMEQIGEHQFVVRWIDRSIEGDAIAQFSLDETGNVSGMTMVLESEFSDFSFDFQDLNFSRLK